MGPVRDLLFNADEAASVTVVGSLAIVVRVDAIGISALPSRNGESCLR